MSSRSALETLINNLLANNTNGDITDQDVKDVVNAIKDSDFNLTDDPTMLQNPCAYTLPNISLFTSPSISYCSDLNTSIEGFRPMDYSLSKSLNSSTIDSPI